MEQTLQDRIRERAHHLWSSGREQGDDNHYWLMAEREVLAEIAAEFSWPRPLRKRRSRRSPCRRRRSPHAKRAPRPSPRSGRKPSRRRRLTGVPHAVDLQGKEDRSTSLVDVNAAYSKPSSVTVTVCALPRHSRTSRVPGLRDASGVTTMLPLTSSSLVNASSFRWVALLNPP